jgi:endonuclease YncB( thermonuclease family)
MNDEGAFMRLKIFLLIIATALITAWAQAQETFPARITRWVDGDTAQIRVLGTPPKGIAPYEVVRLLGINAPEIGEPFSEEATTYFRTLTMGKTVHVELSPWEFRDIYSRLLAYLWVDTPEGRLMVNEALLRAGLARLLVYFPDREKYYCQFLHALTLAQVEKKNLWGKYPEPVSLGELESNPLPYVLEVATVVFEVSRVGQDQEGWSLWAAQSRYGFRAILQPAPCDDGWLQSFLEKNLVGKRIAVTGEIQWDSLANGPCIFVRFPEQILFLGEEK